MIKIRKYDTATGDEETGNVRAEDLGFNFNYSLLRIKAKRRFISARIGRTTFVKTAPYTPTVPPNIAFAVEFDVIERPSTDVKIWRHHIGNSFRVHAKGAYQISTEWYVSISSPALTLVQTLELMLYKNGVAYKRLDLKPMFVWISISANYYLPVMSLQGTKEIDLSPDDLFDIRIRHDGGIPFDATVTQNGYLDIRLAERTL